jgi:Transposase
MRSTYAGVDWASEKHDVVIADETGEEILAATFAHDEAGVRASACHKQAAGVIYGRWTTTS